MSKLFFFSSQPFTLFRLATTLTDVTITLWKLGKKVFYFFFNYKLNAQKMFFFIVMVNGFQLFSLPTNPLFILDLSVFSTICSVILYHNFVF